MGNRQYSRSRVLPIISREVETHFHKFYMNEVRKKRRKKQGKKRSKGKK